MIAQGTRSKIQELYELAKEYLNDGPPSREAAAAISEALGDPRTCRVYTLVIFIQVVSFLSRFQYQESSWVLMLPLLQAPFPSVNWAYQRKAKSRCALTCTEGWGMSPSHTEEVSCNLQPCIALRSTLLCR